MKKFMPILLSVMLIVALVVPASATGETFFTWTNIELMIDIMREQPAGTSIPIDGLDFYSNGKHYTSIIVTKNLAVIFMTYANEEGSDNVYVNDAWTSDAYKFISVPSYEVENWTDIFVDEGYGSFSAPLCVGSTCPATDSNMDNVCDDCGLTFAVPRDYPFTVKNFMNHIGQIFSSAISWVGRVGSTVLQQPLLLAFCALPLCGIGIGFFKRLRNAN